MSNDQENETPTDATTQPYEIQDMKKEPDAASLNEILIVVAVVAVLAGVVGGFIYWRKKKRDQRAAHTPGFE